MKTIQILIRQQNENCNLHNLYVGYNKDAYKRFKYHKPIQLHTMALSLDDAKLLGFNIIIKNPEYLPEIQIETF